MASKTATASTSASYQLVGLGTYKLEGDKCANIVKSGLEC